MGYNSKYIHNRPKKNLKTISDVIQVQKNYNYSIANIFALSSLSLT